MLASLGQMKLNINFYEDEVEIGILEMNKGRNNNKNDKNNKDKSDKAVMKQLAQQT